MPQEWRCGGSEREERCNPCQAEARIALRSVTDLERPGQRIAPMSYNSRGYATLGLLHKLPHVEDPDNPAPSAVA